MMHLLSTLDGLPAQLAAGVPVGAVIPAPVRDLTSILLAGLLAIGLLARAPAGRWTALLAALAIAPLLLAGVALGDDRANRLLEQPLLLVVGGLAGIAVLAVLVALLVRWPTLLPVLIAIALPLRLPISVGGESVNLLLPLYGLIGAGAVAAAIAAQRRARALAQSWDLRAGPTHAAVLREAWTSRSLRGAAAAVPVLLAASVAIYALRIPFSADPDRGAQTFCFFLIPFAVMFVVLREVEWTAQQLRRVAIALVVLALVAVALGDYEYATGRVLWNQNVIDSNSLSTTIRVNSLFFDPNMYGRFLMLVLLGILAALAWGARGVRVGGLALLFAVLWTGLLVTFSQSSMLGLLIGALVLLGLRFGAGRAIATTGVVAVVAVGGMFAFGDTLRLNVTSAQSVGLATSGRTDLIKGGVELFTAKPLLGWGSGSYRRAYREQTSFSSRKAVAASHTIPLTVAAEQGIIGLLIYVALIGAALIALLRRARATLARAAVAAAFVALVVHTWLYAAFLEDPFTWALLAIGLGLGAADEPLDPVDATAPDAGQTAPSPHDVVGEATLVGVGEGAGPGASVGESGRPPGQPA